MTESTLSDWLGYTVITAAIFVIMICVFGTAYIIMKFGSVDLNTFMLRFVIIVFAGGFAIEKYRNIKLEQRLRQ